MAPSYDLCMKLLLKIVSSFADYNISSNYKDLNLAILFSFSNNFFNGKVIAKTQVHCWTCVWVFLKTVSVTGYVHILNLKFLSKHVFL